MTDRSIGRNDTECFPCSARFLLRDAGHHLPLALPDFLAGVFVVVQLCSSWLQATLCRARFGLLPQLGAQNIFLCFLGQLLLEGEPYAQSPSVPGALGIGKSSGKNVCY